MLRQQNQLTQLCRYSVGLQNLSGQNGNVLSLVLVLLAIMSWLGVQSLREGMLQTQISDHHSLQQQVALAVETALTCALQSLPTQLQRFAVELPVYLPVNTTSGCSGWRADQPYQQHVFQSDGFAPVHAITRQQFCGYSSGTGWLNTDVDVFSIQQFRLLAKAQSQPPQQVSITDQQHWQRAVAIESQRLLDQEGSLCFN